MKKKYIYASIVIIVVISAVTFIAFNGGKFVRIEKAKEGEEQPVGPETGDNVTEEEGKYPSFECEEPCNFNYRVLEPRCAPQQSTTQISFKVRNEGKALVEQNDDFNLTITKNGETKIQREFIWPEALLPNKTSERHSFTLDKGLDSGAYNLTLDWSLVVNTYEITC